MRVVRLLIAVGIAALANGCVTTQSDVVSLQPKPKQEYVMRGSERLLASKHAHSVVVLRPVGAELAAEARPIFVVGIENISKQPVDFRVAGVSATLTAPQRQALKVHTYDELVAEQNDRNSDEFFSALILADLSSGAAQQSTAGLDAIANLGSTDARAQSNNIKSTVAGGNSLMVGGSVLNGIERLGELERHVLKDGRVAPGQWHGGQVHIARPAGDGRKAYTIAILVGSDRHEFNIVQQTQNQ